MDDRNIKNFVFHIAEDDSFCTTGKTMLLSTNWCNIIYEVAFATLENLIIFNNKKILYSLHFPYVALC